MITEDIATFATLLNNNKLLASSLACRNVSSFKWDADRARYSITTDVGEFQARVWCGKVVAVRHPKGEVKFEHSGEIVTFSA